MTSYGRGRDANELRKRVLDARVAAAANAVEHNKKVNKYLIAGHGTMILSNNRNSSFTISDDTYIITTTKLNDCPSVDANVLNKLKEFILQNTLFEDYNRTIRKTIDLRKFESLLNSYKYSENISFKNHVPGTLMSNAYISFNPNYVNGETEKDHGIFQLNNMNTSIDVNMLGILDETKTTTMEQIVDELGPGIYIFHVCRSFELFDAEQIDYKKLMTFYTNPQHFKEVQKILHETNTINKDNLWGKTRYVPTVQRILQNKARSRGGRSQNKVNNNNCIKKIILYLILFLYHNYLTTS